MERVTSSKDVRTLLLRLLAEVARDIGDERRSPEDRIHDIRVAMKKIRALLRMVRSDIPKTSYAKADELAGSLKNHFGQARDASVQAALLADLLDQSEAVAVATTLGLDAQNEISLPHPSRACDLCSRLTALVKAFPSFPQESSSLEAAWRETCRAVRRGFQTCRTHRQDDPLFHEWRKRVKRLLYQSSALGPPFDALVPTADCLASTLGTHHDLSLLTDRLADCLAGSRAEQAALAQKAARSERALKLGRKLLNTNEFPNTNA